jgi:hypothetical protein
MLKKYKDFEGLLIRIENPAGTTRMGRGDTIWSTRMQSHYGEIEGTEGVDGDPIDVFLPVDGFKTKKVWAIHQNSPTTGEYDEDKLMCGYANEQEARDAFIKHYDEPDKFIGPITEWDIDELVEVISNSKGKPGKLDQSAKDQWISISKKVSSLYLELGMKYHANIQR